MLNTAGRIRPVLFLLFALMVLAGLGWFVQRRQPPDHAVPQNPPSEPQFTGSAACAECHVKEYQAWRNSHHALAMQEADDRTVLGDFSGVTFSQGGVTSTFFQRDGKFFVHTDGPDGKPADFEVKYTFGVTPMQQYLIPFPDGRMQALGIAWDSRPKGQGGRRWFHLYPDDPPKPGEILHWTGRDQTWNYQCAECHVTDFRKNYDLGQSRYASAWTEMGVGCEACHGPGSEHVALARTGKPLDGKAGFPLSLKRPAGTWTIHDEQRGVAEWQGRPRGHGEVEACGRCHARRGVSTDPYTYGQPLLDSHTPALLTDSLYHADGQIQGEVFEYASFRQSRMQQAGVTCSDCHEPHGVTLRATGNAVCAACHLPARFDTPEHHRHKDGSAGAQCVNCHMPATTYMGVDQRRDHSFRIPRPDLSRMLGTPNACTGCHKDQPPDWAAARLKNWTGREPTPHFATALDAGRKGKLDAEKLLSELAQDDSQAAIARATALGLLPEFLTPASLPVLESGLQDRDPLVRAATVAGMEILPPDMRVRLVAPLLQDPLRGVRSTAARVLADAASTLPHEQKGAFDRALAEAVAAEESTAERPESHLNLANLYLRLGRPEAAEAELATALRLDSRFVPALVNRADLARAQGREADSETHLLEALNLEPDNAATVHALGLLKVRQGRQGAALELFGRAVQLDPRSSRYAYVYAVALDSMGDTKRAFQVLEGAHRRRPADREVLVALVDVARRQGDMRSALRHAEELAVLLPSDSRVQALAAELREAGQPRHGSR